MRKIQAYKCKYCKNIYIRKIKCIECESDCHIKHLEEVRAENFRANFDTITNSIRLSVENLDDLPSVISEYVKKEFNREIDVEFKLTYKNDLCATHDAPIGCKSEWNGSIYYPGWSGRISGSTDIYKNPIKIKFGKNTSQKIDTATDVFRFLIKGINLGTGGGGGDKFAYDVRLYLDDFPKLKEKILKFEILNNKRADCENMLSKLKRQANEELIQNNAEFKQLDRFENILNTLRNNNDKSIDKLEKKILDSKEYADYISLPAELQYDTQEYVKLYEELKIKDYY